ncbi:AraC family transcriptional regulator [Sinimarinibacterium thermocellulolyticum]|uniref:AraC family transcriptional regulator ligand-binding domain-containing protein n=1 Tax=Sinimarinibacterium thermocellulolyticum TaxID=3170016 RepID=A0ABV2A5Y1_9GAMM
MPAPRSRRRPVTGTTVRVPARYYARAAEVLLRQGVDVARALRAARVAPERIGHPDATMRLDQVEALVADVVAQTGRTDFALDVGRALKLSSHSLVGYGMLSSPTADYALRLAARFFVLIMPSFRLRYRGGVPTQLHFEPTVRMSPLCLHFHLEVLAAAAHWELRELLGGELPAYELSFSMAEPPHVARYAELVGARPRFASESTPGVRLRFAHDFGARPLALADPTSLRMAELRCKELVHKVVAVGKVSDWVRMVLRESGDGMPTLVELAHTLNLSPRTLDRYLVREGTGYRALLREARQQKALALLDGGQMSITEIALELGYTDAANFTRAFRREAGVSPSAWRTRGRTTS